MMHLAAALALILLAVPLVTEAQPAEPTYRIGWLATSPPKSPDPFGDAFAQGLRDHGYVEGQNLHIERRFSEGKAERLPALAADLIRLGARPIVALAPGPSRAAKNATTKIPVVFVGVADPIGIGLVTSLARPGGNVTGLTSIEWEAFTAKSLQVAKEALPKTARVAILMNPTNLMHALTLAQAQAAADTLRIKLLLVEARDASELEKAFEAATRGAADLLQVWGIHSRLLTERASPNWP